MWGTSLVVAVLQSVLRHPAQESTHSFTSLWDGRERFFLPGVWDIGSFVVAGDRILAGHWDLPYAFRDNIAGPLQCVVDRLVVEGADKFGALAASIAVSALLYGLIGMVALTLLPRQGPQGMVLACVSVLVLYAADVIYLGYSWGHWWHLIVAASWVWAGLLATRGRWLLAGLALGAGIAAEPWGLLGVLPIAMLATGARARLGIVMVAAWGALAWLPFALQPSFSMGDYAWGISGGSAWELLGVSSMGWQTRVAQCILIVVPAGLVALWARRRLSAAWASWLLATTIMFLRIAFDSMNHPYYWAAGVALLVAGAVAALAYDWLCSCLLWCAAVMSGLGWSWLGGGYPRPFLLAGAVAVLSVLAVWFGERRGLTPPSVSRIGDLNVRRGEPVELGADVEAVGANGVEEQTVPGG